MPPARGRILVVDDTPANLSLLLDALGDAGHVLQVADSGERALALLERTTPDLVLLDAVMPGLDGFATCRRIRARPEWQSIPVLFLTALQDADEKVRAFEAGAVDYIAKPVYVPEVLARVKAHLQIALLQRSLAERNAQLEAEVELRTEAENQLRESLDRAVLAVQRDGRIVFATRLATDLLFRFAPDFGGERLPVAWWLAVERRLDALARSGTGGTTAALELSGAGGKIEVRIFAEAGAQDVLVLVLTSPQGPNLPALMKLGITARQAEVVYWIGEGKSNQDVATILATSVRTVQKHVERIFERLGIENRAALVRIALEAAK